MSKKSLHSRNYIKTEATDKDIVVQKAILAEKTVHVAAESFTPALLPIHESVFQSGIRSVRKLLWGT